MPRSLTPQQFMSKYQTSNVPTQSLAIDPTTFYQDFPNPTPDVLSGITYFLGLLDSAMGWTIPTTTTTNGIPTALSEAQSLLGGFSLTSVNSFWDQINTGPLAQDLQSLGTLINEQLGGTASTVNIFITDNGTSIRELEADGTQINDNTVSVVSPVGIAFDSSDNLYIADNGNAMVVMVTVDAIQSTLEFTGLINPVDVAVDGFGTVYVADNSGAVYSLTTAGVQTQLNFVGLVSPTAIDVDSLGDVYVADSGAAKVFKMTAGGTQSTMAFTGLTGPQGVLVDPFFSVYVSDGTHVYKLDLFNSQTTVGFTGLAGPKHLDMDSAGVLYVADGVFVYRLSTSGSQSDVGFTGLTAPVGIAVQNAQWADIEVALQQIQSQSDANWNALLADLGLGSVAGSGDNTLSNWLSGIDTGVENLFSELFGTNLAPALTGSVSAPTVTAAVQNSQSVSDFPTPESLSGNEFWQYDGSTTYVDSDGNVSNSVMALANGMLLQTYGVVIPVQAGQTVAPAGVVSWLGLLFTPGSSPIQLQLIPGVINPVTQDFTPGTPIKVAEVSPTSPVSNWVAVTGITGAGVVDGVYTVPDEGVTGVQAALTVTQDATAGWVWFAACTNTTAGGFLPSLGDDTNNIISSFAPGGTSEEFVTGVQDFLAYFGLSSDTISTSTLTAFWTAIITDIINPLNQIEAAANKVIVGIDNDLTDVFDWLFGVAAPTSASQVLPAAVASSAGGTSMGSDVSEHFNAISAATGTSGDSLLDAATAGIQLLTKTVSTLSAQVSSSNIAQFGSTFYGQGYQVVFSDYPDTTSGTTGSAAFSQAPFDLTRSGAGSGYLSIVGGEAIWNEVSDGDVSVIGIFNNGGSGQAFTNTDYQIINATIGGLPNGTNAKNFAVARANSLTAPTTYVYGVVYLNSSFQLCWELGCYVSGVHTVLDSGTGAPLNFNFTFRPGVGGNPYRFQGVSGSTVVFDYIDTAHVSQVGSSYRYWGFRSDTSDGGQATPAPAAYVGCADNALPTTQGSGFRKSCSSTTSQSISVATNTSPPSSTPGWGYFPTGFFDTTDNLTPDIISSTYGGEDAMTIGTEGWYMFELRSQMNASAGSGVVSIYAGYLRNGDFESLANGPSVAVNVFGTQWAPTALGGNCPIYCKAGDQIVPIVYVDATTGTSYLSALDVFGEANNRLTYWSMTRMFGA